MGATALHLAVFASHELCVKELLDHGANTKLTIKKGALAGTAPHEV
jgi:ankyrin repeat protein